MAIHPAAVRTAGSPAFIVRRTAESAPAVELWTATEAEDEWLAARTESLSNSERSKFARMRSPARSWRAMSARILLRAALSHACGCSVPAEAWQFCAAPNGKPRIGPGLPQLHFSVSHAEAMAVVAVSRDLELGIDVESLDQIVGEDVIATFLSPNEQRGIAGSEREERINLFLRLWTLKEAYAKLIGEGLGLDFAAIEFDVNEAKLRATAYGHADARFETFVVPAGRARCQVSLAIGASTSPRNAPA